MTIRLRISLAAALVVASALSLTPVFAAQSGGSGNHPRAGMRGERRAMMRDRIVQELGLTAEQQNRIQQIRDTQREALQAARQNTSEKRRALQDAMLADPNNQGEIEARRSDLNAARSETIRLMQNMQQQIFQVLTPEQRDKLREMRSEHQGHRGGGKRLDGGRKPL